MCFKDTAPLWFLQGNVKALVMFPSVSSDRNAPTAGCQVTRYRVTVLPPVCRQKGVGVKPPTGPGHRPIRLRAALPFLPNRGRCRAQRPPGQPRPRPRWPPRAAGAEQAYCDGDVTMTVRTPLDDCSKTFRSNQPLFAPLPALVPPDSHCDFRRGAGACRAGSRSGTGPNFMGEL